MKIKKTAAIILVFSILIFAFLKSSYAQKLLTGKNVQTDKLSGRSEEFIKSQREGSETWDNVNFSKKGAQGLSTIDVDGCFAITIPFQITNVRKDADCDFHIATERPKSTIIAYLTSTSVGSINDDSGVGLRRRKTDLYEEYSQKIDDRTFIIFKRKGGAFERHAFLWLGKSMLVVNMKALTSEDFTKDFHAMLNSVELTQ